MRHPDYTAVELLSLVRDHAGSLADVTHSGAPFVEVSAAGMHKAVGLARLCQDLGIEASEVVAFGDMPNDIPMLSWAGLGVAVANADPDVLAIADEVTASHMDDGVAVVVERILAEQGAVMMTVDNRSGISRRGGLRAARSPTTSSQVGRSDSSGFGGSKPGGHGGPRHTDADGT